MNLKFFILGLCVLVSIVQISTAQSQESSQSDEDDGKYQDSEPEDHTEDEIQQRRKITSIMNSAVNIIDPPETHQEITQVQSQQSTNFMAQPSAPFPSLLGGLTSMIGNPGGGLLGKLFDLLSNLLPLLKPLWNLLKSIWPLLKNMLGPLLKAITKLLPLLPKFLDFLKPLLHLPVKIANFLKTLFGCLKTIFDLLLKGFKLLLKGFKTLYNLLPVIPKVLGIIPAVIEGLWRVWRSLRYAILYPIRTLKRWLGRIVRMLYGIPRYLGAILRGLGHLLASPVRILGFFFKRAFIVFNDYVIIPVARLKYFLINLFDVLLGPLNITRHFLEELACLFIKTPLRVIRSMMRALFVNGILNTIRYIKTVIFEIIRVPWSRHYADMFPSLGNRHNYVLPNQIVCQGKAC